MTLRVAPALIPGRPRRRSATARIAALLGGSDARELDFEAIDDVWHPPAREHGPDRPPPHLYTARGRTRALALPTLGRHVDLRA